MQGIGQAQKQVKVTAQGLKLVNSDDVFEKYLRDAQLNFKMDANQGKQRDTLRQRAKVITKKKQDNYVEGRLGMVIDGTGKDYGKITKQASDLKQIGYDVYMIFVNTSLDVALANNKKRARTLKDNIVKDSWNAVQKNMGKFQRYFGGTNFIIVDNNEVDKDGKLFDACFKRVKGLLSNKVVNPQAKRWIDREIQKRRR